MLKTYAYPKFEYRRPPELDGPGAGRRPVIVVGAGPVGMAAAIDLALQGVPVLLLDEDDTVSIGSRGVCYAKRTLEILDRLGIGDAVCGKGVSWDVGRTFFRDREVYRFNLRPQADHKRPGMINLQQYYLEEMLVERCVAVGVEMRWKNKVVAVHDAGSHVVLEAETPEGRYAIDCDWLIVADGARSPIRHMLGLDVEGKIFTDRFLIADVVMQAEFPAERWFWFDPPFHPNQSVLLHKQADNVWRIDFQLGWDADPEEEKAPERVVPRIQAMLGKERPFELEWVSVYTFRCRRMQKFRHGRLLFAGDAAHQVSPFGARGANSGVQDTDNLAWKLALVLGGQAPEALLDTYSDERVFAADENILNSTRSTDFITPKSAASRIFRNAALQLAGRHAFARRLVNSGRLSVPSIYTGSALSSPDVDAFAGDLVPGAPLDDAPLEVDGEPSWLLDQLGGRFQLLVYVERAADFDADLAAELNATIPVETVLVTAAPGGRPRLRVLHDARGRFLERYDALPGSAWLVRPDQHVAARWRRLEPRAVRAALARATCN